MAAKDKLFYKQRPYIYAFLGIVAFAFARRSKLAFLCGVVLLICSYAVFEMRRVYQEKQALLKSKAKSEENKLAVQKIVIDETEH